MKSISIANKFLHDPTRMYGILDKMLWNPYQYETRSYKIL